MPFKKMWHTKRRPSSKISSIIEIFGVMATLLEKVCSLQIDILKAATYIWIHLDSFKVMLVHAL